MTAVELLPPGTGPHDERWHQLRRAGVTASEIAVVMGISPYESPFSLYWQKVNDWRWEGNEYTSAGQHLEPSIADWWLTQGPDRHTMHAGLYAHTDRPWQLATPDRIIIDIWGKDIALLECKWVAYSWDGWGEPGTDDVPVHYRAQALWQLDTLGVDEVHFAALGPGGFRSYLVRRDEADLELMWVAGAKFMERLEKGDPPPLDSHTATLGALKKLYPTVGTGEVEVSPELATKYRIARAAKKVAEERIAECEAEIRHLLEEDCGRAMCEGKLVASRSVYERAAYSVSATTIDKLNPGRTKA
jgi:putative phage-type endonuclease